MWTAQPFLCYRIIGKYQDEHASVDGLLQLLKDNSFSGEDLHVLPHVPLLPRVYLLALHQMSVLKSAVAEICHEL